MKTLKASRVSRARHGLVALTTGASLLGSGVTLAQDEKPAEDSNLLQEVVVTAQFREENLQDTPIAITAVMAEMLEARS